MTAEPDWPTGNPGSYEEPNPAATIPVDPPEDPAATTQLDLSTHEVVEPAETCTFEEAFPISVDHIGHTATGVLYQVLVAGLGPHAASELVHRYDRALGEVVEHRTSPDGAVDSLLAATEVAVRTVRDTGLFASRIETFPGSATGRHWDPLLQEWTGRLPRINVDVFSRPAEFLAWADYLGADYVLVRRRELDTVLNLRHAHDGYLWGVTGMVRRPDEGPHLPLIEVRWDRGIGDGNGDTAADRGQVTREALRTTLAALGYPRGAQ